MSTTVTNSNTSSNPDYPVKVTETVDGQVQHIALHDVASGTTYSSENPLPVSDEQLEGTINRLLSAVRNPPYIDKSLNRIRETSIIESGTITTVTTVATVTTLATLSGYQSQLLPLAGSRTSWAVNVRARYT